jgi:hypothetical protein
VDRYLKMAALASLLLVQPVPAASPAPGQAEIKGAATRALALLEKSTAEYLRHRSCFSCHHQALPVLALAEARKRGLAVDEKNWKAQLQHTLKHLQRGRESYRKGRGQGGRADTAGYALWTLEAGEHQPDKTTGAVTHFLLAWSKDQGYWRPSGNRPPSEASRFTTTYLAVRAIHVFGTKEQQEEIATRNKKALAWLRETKPRDTEDRVFQLRALHYLGAPHDQTQPLAKELLEAQRDDGGWAQKGDMDSDAYATGTVLVALLQTGHLKVDDPVYQRGLQFLIRTQKPDGSWHVKSRSKPFQTYFESGFPHGKDQFISITASSWATLALLLARR